MSLKLPLHGDELRDLFDPMDLVRIIQKPHGTDVPSFDDAIARGRAHLALYPEISAIHYIAKSSEGSLELFKVGRTMAGSLWSFGKV